MRLHIQNPPASDLSITPAQWEAAIARHPDMAHLAMTMAEDLQGLEDGLREAEVLVTWTGLPGDPLRAAPLRVLPFESRSRACPLKRSTRPPPRRPAAR